MSIQGMNKNWYFNTSMDTHESSTEIPLPSGSSYYFNIFSLITPTTQQAQYSVDIYTSSFECIMLFYGFAC
jgi:hypothetical protein